MIAEIGARRKRLRAAFGDRSQALVEFLVLGGLAVGSLGLLLGEWMPAAAPWGFALPFVFVAGFFLIEARRQAGVARFRRDLPQINADLDAQEWARADAELRANERSAVFQAEAKAKFESEAGARRQYREDNPDLIVAAGYDWAVFLWAFFCALLGAAAFIIALTARPEAAPPVDDGWRPPEGAVSSDIVPVAP